MASSLVPRKCTPSACSSWSPTCTLGALRWMLGQVPTPPPACCNRHRHALAPQAWFLVSALALLCTLWGRGAGGRWRRLQKRTHTHKHIHSQAYTPTSIYPHPLTSSSSSSVNITVAHRSLQGCSPPSQCFCSCCCTAGQPSGSCMPPARQWPVAVVVADGGPPGKMWLATLPHCELFVAECTRPPAACSWTGCSTHGVTRGAARSSGDVTICSKLPWWVPTEGQVSAEPLPLPYAASCPGGPPLRDRCLQNHYHSRMQQAALVGPH
jgi:hypothetical protein